MENIPDFNLGKSLLLRFARGFIAGGVSTMAMVVISLHAQTFADLPTFFTSLAVAGIVGAVTGALLALDKFVRAQ